MDKDEPSISLAALQEKEDLEKEEKEEEEDIEVNNDLCNIFALSHDATHVHMAKVTDI